MSATLAEFPFEIESTFVVQGRAYVLARSLTQNVKFQVVEGSTLGGQPIEVFVDVPRKLDESGELRVDLFVFALHRPEAMREFTQGDLVVLCAAGCDARLPPLSSRPTNTTSAFSQVPQELIVGPGFALFEPCASLSERRADSFRSGVDQNVADELR
jgi:hypothetical protein